MVAEVSPFIIDWPLPPETVTGRDEVAGHLRAMAKAGRSVCLYAPRRYGKTSLLHKVAADVRRHDSMAAVVVDLYGVVSLHDLVVRLEQGYRQHLMGRARRVVDVLFRSTNLGLSLGGFGVSMHLQRNPNVDPVPVLHALLDLPTRIHEDRAATRVLVILDEFQALGRLEAAEGILRSHAQHQRNAASYLFAGSEPGMLQAMFSDPGRAFYGQAETLRLGRLDTAVLADVIVDGFTKTQRSVGSVLPLLLATAEGHPQRAMLLAHRLWQETAPGATAAEADWVRARENALRAVRYELEARWEGLTSNQQRVVRAVVEHGSPFSGTAQASLGLAAGSAGKTVDHLLAAGILERDERERIGLTDPLLTMWVETRFARLGLEPPATTRELDRRRELEPPAPEI